MLDKLSESLDGKGAGKPSVKEALAQLKSEKADERRRHLHPTDAELLDEDDGSAEDAVSTVAELRKAKAEQDKPVPQPARPAGSLAAAAVAVAGDATPPAPPPPKQQPAVKTPGKPGGLDAMFAAKKPKQSAGARPETYTVQAGDTLFKISTRFYGSSHKWKDIFEANRAIVPADGRVRAGQVLKLP